MEDCYTQKERECFVALMKAHDLFMKLDRQHPTELTMWVDAIHQQQFLFGMRILRRDHPNEFATIVEKHEKPFTNIG